MSKNLIELDLLQFKSKLDISKEKGLVQIFDPIRKKKLVQTPEELVRQLVIQYLVHEKQYRPNKISVEKMLLVNERRKRFDLLIYSATTEPVLLVECKAPSVPVTEDAFRQIASYNITLKVPYLLVTNGIHSYCCKIDHSQQSFEFLQEVPDYAELYS